MKKTKLLLQGMILLAACSLLLTACDDVDWDFLMDWFSVCAEQNGWYADDQVQIDRVAAKIVEDTAGGLMQSDEHIQLEGLEVIRDIEQAEALSDQALKERDPEKMEDAKDIRSNDWAVLEKEAVMFGALENSYQADLAIAESDSLLIKNLVESGGDCVSARRSQLETRIQITWDEIMALEGGPGNTQTAIELREIHKAASEELRMLNTAQASYWCEMRLGGLGE